MCEYFFINISWEKPRVPVHISTYLVVLIESFYGETYNKLYLCNSEKSFKANENILGHRLLLNKNRINEHFSDTNNLLTCSIFSSERLIINSIYRPTCFNNLDETLNFSIMYVWTSGGEYVTFAWMVNCYRGRRPENN